MKIGTGEENGSCGSMATRNFVIGSPVRLVSSPYIDLDKLARTEGRRERAIYMAERDNMIAEALDALSPELGDGLSHTLQNKALRAIFSVGFDAMVMDAQTSAHCGKLCLGPEAMLTSGKTESIFGNFEVPADFT